MKFFDGTKCNLYIRYEPVYNLSIYLNKSIYIDNIDNSNSMYHRNINAKMYLQEYIKQIKKKKRNYKNKKNIEAQSLEILIPRELHIKDDKKIIKNVIKEVVKEFSNGIKVKYFCISRKENKQIKVNVVIFDRNLYPAGKRIKKTRRSSWWTDNKGIRRNLDSYKGNDTLKLKYAAGDSYEQIIYISDKIRFIGFANIFEGEHSSIIFESNMNSLKVILMNVMSVHGIKFKKINTLFKMENYKRLIKKNGRWIYIHKNLDEHDVGHYYKIRKKQLLNSIYYSINRLQYNNDIFSDIKIVENVKNYLDVIKKKITNSELKEAEDITAKVLEKIKNKNIFFDIDNLEVSKILKLTNKSDEGINFIISDIF